jgi:hypothetical protein
MRHFPGAGLGKTHLRLIFPVIFGFSDRQSLAGDLTRMSDAEIVDAYGLCCPKTTQRHRP